jgi:hypothetical protein
MVGFRVFDIGGLIIWLRWFKRQTDEVDDEDEPRDGGGGSNRPHTPEPPLLPGSEPWPERRREHSERMPAPRRRDRTGHPAPDRRRAPA